MIWANYAIIDIWVSCIEICNLSCRSTKADSHRTTASAGDDLPLLLLAMVLGYI